jgi:pimeloyl-ACP methyl ester carboxylesterase
MEKGAGVPRLRRAYFECRHGQLHVHNAIPAGGGFDEQTTLLCLHGIGVTGRSFLEFSKLLGTTRSIYSPDIPGCGESDASEKPLGMAGYAEAIGDFIDSMRFRQLDLLGVQTGAAAAIELALSHPKVVRRLVLVGAPLLDEDGRKSWRDLSAPQDLTPGEAAFRAALSDWRAEARVVLVKQPVLVLRPKDAFYDASARANKLLNGAKVVDLPDQERAFIEKGAAVAARHVTPFLGA